VGDEERGEADEQPRLMRDHRVVKARGRHAPIVPEAMAPDHELSRHARGGRLEALDQHLHGLAKSRTEPRIGQDSVAPDRIDQGARMERVQERRHEPELYSDKRCD
jgi:hypothetical protein